MSPDRRSGNIRRITAVVASVLASVLIILSGANVAPASPEPPLKYNLAEVYPGDDLHIPVLMWRFRHTVLASRPGAPAGTVKVGYAANVAAFNFRRNGIEMVAVGQSIARQPGQNKVLLIDFYRKDPKTGDWELVDRDGEPLTVDGKVLKWYESSEPSESWDLSLETASDIKKELKTGIHSERTVALFLERKLDGANKTTTKGLSERIPCEDPNHQCKVRLTDDDYFPNLTEMKWVIDLPNTVAGVLATASPAPTGGPSSKKKPPKVAVAYHTAPAHLEDIEDEWEDAGMPTNSDDAEYGFGYRTFVTPDSEPATGPAASALAPGSNPGGIDFSTLQLRYLSEAPGGRLQYAFAASGASPSMHNVEQGRIAAVQASDAFFVWLSMPRSSFWVNLNPNEPDRIVDAKLGTTDVGRILLQADFAMKKLVGKLIYPKSPLGKKYWATSHPGSCLDTRQWIVPAPATVYEHDGGISIIKAPLNVKMESQYLKGQSKADSCVHPDAGMEKAFRTLVLPRVVQAVNHAPQFAELRRVYLSRVAAEWYRTKHGRDGALRSLIDSGNVSDWRAMKAWSPRRVFNQYVYSFKHKEFRVKERTRKGHKVYIKTYTYGGVDFSKVLLHDASTSAVQHDDPGLSGTVRKCFGQVTKDRHGTVWLGAVSRPHLPKAAGQRPTRQPVFPAGDFAAVLVCGFLAVGFVVGLILAITFARGRRRALLVTAMAVLLVGSLVTGVVSLERGAVRAVQGAAGPPAPRTHSPTVPETPTISPTPTGGAPSPSVPTTAPSHRASVPAKPKPKPKPKSKPKHQVPRWTKPQRGHRPSSSMFALTWRKRDRADLRQLDQLTFSFAIPRGYACEEVPYRSEVFCGHGFTKKDPYVVIVPGTCGCTLKQVRTDVNRVFGSKKAFGRMFPVDPFTRVSDNSNGKANYQYWMVRVYGARGSRRLDHDIVVYGQANKKADDVRIRKIIGDIYDATR